MSSFGVLPEGFRQKTLEEIIAELEEAERAAFGSDINTQADSVLGQLNGIFADQISQVWEVALGVYRALYPDSASGEALDNVAAITGTTRLPAAPSTVTLLLNLDAAATLPVGRIVSVGALGEQWETTEEVTNAGADRTIVEVEAESSNTGQVVGNESTINTIVTPVSGWSAKALVETASVEPFKLEDGLVLEITVDNGDVQEVEFDTADFVDIAAATAAEIVDVINDNTTGCTATERTDGGIRIESDTDGDGSALEISSDSDANPILGFPHEPTEGFNWSRSAKLTSEESEDFVLVNNQTLVVVVDGGSPQTVTFLTADFVAIATAKAAEVAAKISSSLTGARAYDYAGQVRIESLTTGVSSSIEVTGGSANAALGFAEDDPTIGTSGDATPGNDIESDSDFRLRREQLLRASGAATVEAIRAAVRALDDVLQALVFENTTDATDVNGLPPHSFEVVVSGGDDTEIGEEIFDVKPAGIATYRDPGAAGRTVEVTDSQGFTHDINFTRPTEIEMWIEIEIEIDASEFGGGDEDSGIEEVQDALKALGDSLQVGDDVVINRFIAEAFTITGVTDVTDIKIDDVDPPVGIVNFAVAIRELATFSTARITVNIA